MLIFNKSEIESKQLSLFSRQYSYLNGYFKHRSQLGENSSVDEMHYSI